MSSVGAPEGNQNAKKGKAWELAIKRALARKAKDSFDRGLDRVADKLVAAAIKGDTWAIKEVGDRIDGKAVQGVEGTIEHDHTGTITHEHKEGMNFIEIQNEREKLRLINGDKK